MDDPLPLPLVNRNLILISFHNRKTKQFVALILCLFLSITLGVFPHLMLEVGKPGLWILKYNSNITQAPRGAFFGALVVLPRKTDLESVLLPQLREIIKDIIEVTNQTTKYWLVMFWYGSSYT